MHDFIEVYDDVLTAEFCQQLIRTFELSPHTTAGRTGGGVDTSKKISTDLYLNQHAEYQQQLNEICRHTSQHVMEYFRKYYFALIGPMSMTLPHPSGQGAVTLTADNFDEFGRPQVPQLTQAIYRLGPIQLQKYQQGKGNYNYWHSEVYPQLGHNEALHRALLFMFYLNDVSDGGQTEFYYQKKAIQPKAGRMVIAPAYFTHTHRGCVPVSGDKYILTSWVLFNRAEQIYGQPG
ncbi:2OG-Fe(II) oxygenase [Rheinheimera marina]|uniref:2OG-Fe(II) oxygenase n=1 Tax=Rheinheimera marina TaxID=1774958 RepID=A0ABV9JFW6_9GAMM